MHHQPFSAAIRRWASADRRGFLRRLAAAAFALPLAGADVESVAGKNRKRKRKRCNGGKKRCGRKCVRGTCCPGRACGSAEPNCRCGRTVEGRAFCQTGGIIVVDPCASSADCDPGAACILDDGIAGGSLCVPACGAP